MFITKSDPRSSAHNPSHCDEFAESALGEVFRACDLCLAREPDFVDRQPRRLGETVNKIVAETGQKAVYHWLEEAGRAETQKERVAAPEIAQNIAKSLDLNLEDFLLGRAA